MIMFSRTWLSLNKKNCDTVEQSRLMLIQEKTNSNHEDFCIVNISPTIVHNLEFSNQNIHAK